MTQHGFPYERPPPHPLLPIAQRKHDELRKALGEVQRLTERAAIREARIDRLEYLLNITLDGWGNPNRDNRQST